MTDFSTMLSLADIAVALSGFSGLIVSYQHGSALKTRSADLVGVTMILVMGLGVAFFAFLPAVLSNFALSENIIWGASSLLAAIFTGYVTNFIRVRLLKAVKKKSARRLFKLQISIGYLMPVILIFNALNPTDVSKGGIYMLILLISLVIVGYSFCRLLLYPLWLSAASSAQVKTP
tara:strand:+ start:275 stop:802 length:528 start_codon:yes stop_codon:yes gene_type:complete